MLLPPLLALAGLIAVHLVTHLLRFLDGVPRSPYLSAAGGVSLAYVFLHLLPEIAEGQEMLDASAGEDAWFGFGMYAVALAGLIAFFAAERMVRDDGRAGREALANDGEADTSASPAFWVHMASFTVYNAVTGYLLVHRAASPEGDEASPLVSMAVFALAMGLHFLLTDFGLSRDFQRSWRRIGRWLVTAALVAGWLVGQATDLPEVPLALVTAILGGGMILNVLKEEVPGDRKARIAPLVAGVVGFGALLAAMG